MVNRALTASMFSRMAVSGRTRSTPTRPAIGSHHAPRPSMTRPCPSTLPPSSHMVLKLAAITTGLRVQMGSTPAATLMRRVWVKNAVMATMQSRARRLSPCQISLKPRSSMYRARSSSSRMSIRSCM